MKPTLAALCALFALMPAAMAAEPIVNSLGMRFVPIAAGSFVMGSPEHEPGRDSDERQRRVTLTRDFYIQTTEVTQGQWRALTGDNPASFRGCGDDCPVEGVTWEQVQAFIERLNRREPDRTYRLPTEAEWEYVARAGGTAPFATGDCLSTEQANVSGDRPLPGCPQGPAGRGPMPVASFAPNAWGVYDMHGNVWELCQDWYGEYPPGDAVDPVGPPTGTYRVIRGGSWRFPAAFARSANRFRNVRDIAGFRLVLLPNDRPAAGARSPQSKP